MNILALLEAVALEACEIGNSLLTISHGQRENKASSERCYFALDIHIKTFFSIGTKREST